MTLLAAIGEPVREERFAFPNVSPCALALLLGRSFPAETAPYGRGGDGSLLCNLYASGNLGDDPQKHHRAIGVKGYADWEEV